MIRNFINEIKNGKDRFRSSPPRSGSGVWNITTSVIALLVSIPILTILFNIFIPAGEVWAHLASTVLPDYIRNSLWLMIGVGTGVFLLGVGTAWLVTRREIPGLRIVDLALILPASRPASMLAYNG